MEYNKDTTIEVGDLVRVVTLDRDHDDYVEELGAYLNKDFIVQEVFDHSKEPTLYRLNLLDDSWRFVGEWLEIMTPKAELESVYAEEKRLEEKKDKCYEILKDCYNKGDWDLFEMATEIEAIFNQD